MAIYGQSVGASASTTQGHQKTLSQSVKRPTGIDSRIVSAAGVKQRIDCRGSGSVTLLVIPGLGSPARTWSSVASKFRTVTRTCLYDRPGVGASPTRPNKTQVVDAGLYALELAALLKAAREPGPYVVLGHSFGGLVARAFILKNMSVIRGVLLAESVDPADNTTGAFWSEAGHSVNMALSQAASGGGPKLGRLPLLVLSASHPEEDYLGGPTYGQPAWMIDQWVAQQLADVQLSGNSIQVIAASGHVLQHDAPKTAVEAVRVLLHAVLKKTQLSCSTVWASLNATCR
jgi:pimeloyl-ACP methyl ester carboxylesterase